MVVGALVVHLPMAVVVPVVHPLMVVVVLVRLFERRDP
jgi:hypothetical protein